MTLQQAEILVNEEARYEPDFDDSGENDTESLGDFDIVSLPNDFNVMTIVDFIKSGVVKIPGFQRNFVWDIKRASKLVESVLIGLPIPQLFLYEDAPNRFLVIDGQQRLMSIYYFVKERFPKTERLIQLRQLFDEKGHIPEDTFNDDTYFTNFHLNLPERFQGHGSRFNRLTYSTLGDQFQTTFNLRTIRNIIVKQVNPSGNDSMYEIFNRLNSGGVNLTPQEIRRCMYDSAFYDALYRTNILPEWRRLVGTPIPDLHMKDVEILLRGFAMLVKEESYRPSMVKFLNGFSDDARAYDVRRIRYLEELLGSFIACCKHLPDDAFQVTGRFSPMIFESVFVAVCSSAYSNSRLVEGEISPESLRQLRGDQGFLAATQTNTTATAQVQKRLSRARDLVSFP